MVAKQPPMGASPGVSMRGALDIPLAFPKAVIRSLDAPEFEKGLSRDHCLASLDPSPPLEVNGYAICT